MSSFVMAMKELERGRELAHQLRRFMFSSSAHEEDDDGVKGKKALTTSSAAEDLASKVLDSFTNALSLFNNPPDSSSPSSFCNLPASSDESHQSPKRRRRSPTTSSIIKHPTASSPKKRKIIETTWEEESKMSPKEDGHAWRKYGQKYILNSKHPRNYFRCTHKYEQGCEATKQVQKIQDDPPLYKTTYFGHHTCTNFLNPHIFVDDSHDYDDYLNSTSACILSFDNNHSSPTTFDQKLKTQQNHLFLSSSSSSLFPSSGPAKNEDNHCDNDFKKDNISGKIKVVVPSCSSNDYLVSADHDEEAVVPFGYDGGDDDHLTMDVFNSSLFDDPLVFEDYSLFEMI